MPWRSSSVMDVRIEFVVLANAGIKSMSELCREFGISRPTGYRWLNRYREVNSVNGLVEKSRRPHRIPGRTPAAIENRVIELRVETGWGAKKLSVLLSRVGISVPVITINRILKRNGLIDTHRTSRPSTMRFERSDPNELWQMDFKGEFRGDDDICYPLSILDDHSRYAVGLIPLRSKNTDDVQCSLVTVFEHYGVPSGMLIDHGSPWWSPHSEHGLTRVTVGLIKQGIRLHFSGFRHPQTQGKVERFHRSIEDKIRHKGRPSQFSGWVSFLRDFRYEYNHIRPHEALDMDIPASRYRPSERAYDPTPREWEYPEGSTVKRVDTTGSISVDGSKYFACRALVGEKVRMQEISGKLVVSYRDMYIREIDRSTGRSRALLLPVDPNKQQHGL